MHPLTTFVTKLNSIQDLVALESGAQGDELRCVVLTDFIRKAELPKMAARVSYLRALVSFRSSKR
jgi:hypothetical protein